jgi:hypothetical protein
MDRRDSRGVRRAGLQHPALGLSPRGGPNPGAASATWRRRSSSRPGAGPVAPGRWPRAAAPLSCPPCRPFKNSDPLMEAQGARGVGFSFGGHRKAMVAQDALGVIGRQEGGPR